MRASARQEIDEFLKELTRLRQNDESVLPAMRERAERLCRDYQRCEAPLLLKYFAALLPAQRTLGLAQEARFFELRDRVKNAGDRGMLPEPWKALREEVIAGLRALVNEDTGVGDCTAAARALALCARLEVEHAAGDSQLSADERDDLLDGAEQDARESISRFQRAGMLAPQFEPRWLLGRISAARAESGSARRKFQDSLALARRVENKEYEELALDALIHLAEEAGDIDENTRLVEDLAKVCSPAECWPLARAQARLLMEHDQAELASEFLARCEPTDDRSKSEWRILRGLALLRAGRTDEARSLWELDTPSDASFDVQCRTAALQLRLGNPNDTLKRFGSVIVRDELEPSQRMRVDALVGEALLQLNEPGEAIEPLENALKLARKAQARLADQRGYETSTTNLLGERDEIGMQTVALLAIANARVGNDLDAARVIETFQSSTLQDAAAGGGGARRHAHQAFDPDVLAWARHFELGLVTWVVGADSTVVAHVTPDGRSYAQPIAYGRRAIEGAVRRLREAVLSNDDVTVARRVSELRTALLPAGIAVHLEEHLRHARGRLLFLLHGPLERLPIELFMLTGDALGDRCVPVVLPGLTAAIPGNPPTGAVDPHWTLLGNPVDGSGSALLPGAAAELDEIARLQAGSARFTGAAFDHESMTRALKGTSAVHLATHLVSGCGEDNGRMADVGLELSRGQMFCANEILELKPTLPMVVLDACETAGGRFVDAEGLQGISRAFLESGTRNLVVTLWPVDDASAREFAVALHRALIEGDGTSAAVDRARRELRARGHNVADWAAFRAMARD
jgi:CHAT domain-containing protein